MKNDLKYQEIHCRFMCLAQESVPVKGIFFKTGAGDYAEGDKFLGIKVPVLRGLVKEYRDLEFDCLSELLASCYNEERLFALFILVEQYNCASERKREIIYQFFLAHKERVNNWNLVDSSAHLIVGRHLLPSDIRILAELAESDSLWDRRIAIVSTWYFIRSNHFEPTLHLAKQLLYDKHDLIHKAVGWMLREVGARDTDLLKKFLDQYAFHMPRTMLRYAIEKFSSPERQAYLLKVKLP